MKEVLKTINSRVELNTNQIECLSNLQLANLNHCLNTFVMWMENGMYDFSGLPLTLKVHLQPNTVQALKAIPYEWKGVSLFVMCFSNFLSCFAHIHSNAPLNSVIFTFSNYTQT